MADRYANFARTAAGRALVKRLGLPAPPALRRYRPGDPLVSGPVLLGGVAGGRVTGPLAELLGAAGVEVVEPGAEPDGRQPMYAALLFDATAQDRKSTRLNSSHVKISYAVFCLRKKNRPLQ